jgi:hypothetical protein
MVIFNAASRGLGTASDLVSEEATLQVEKVCRFPTLNRLSSCTDSVQLMFAGDIFYVLALSWSQLSVCLFFRRLLASTERTLLADILACACVALGVISVFVIGLRQQVMEPWLQGPVLGQSTVSEISKRWIIPCS